EYALRFADRAYKHMFNGGALTPENGAAQWDARAQGIRLAMKAESARWGDHADSNPRTLVDFDRGLQREYNTWFPRRTPISISQFRAAGLYPEIDPPVFSQHGGKVSAGSGLLITNDTGDIYYTVDGSDPRLAGGGIHPNSIKINGAKSDQTLIEAGAPGWSYLDDGSDQGTSWREPAYDDSLWGIGDAPLGFGSVNNHPFGGPWINPDRNTTVYFRKEFEITNANLITEATARVMSDGGAIVYLNGVEIARDNMPADPVNFETFASSDSNIREGNIDVFSFLPSAFVDGINVIAIELHNGSSASSDMGMDLQLDVTTLNTLGDAVTINGPTTVRTRSFDGSDWSALNEATFVTDLPASADNLIISEIFYHPAGDSEVAEYIELMNIAGESISLAGVVFTGGLSFSFSNNTILEAGERLLLVADLDGFKAAFGDDLPVVGSYTGRLDNGGESLSLDAADGTPILNFRYNDRAPWPLPADGNGYSLTLISPSSNPDLSDAVNWRASANLGGSPGRSDALPFEGSTAAELFEYALDDPMDGISGSFLNLENNGSFDDYLVVTVAAKLAADDAQFVIEFSQDLENWERGTALYLGSEDQPNGSSLRRWRAPESVSFNQPMKFARLVLTARP
ncbi:MAG TPA: hypothetical protein DIV46_13495, partial [Verrucomicrobiales bacterium]|nr:hypothetical protein [Verrucomicrobiales bacterium]